MANWALVENDEVTGLYDLLPKSWKHISGLRLAADDLDFLKSLGWYPVDQQHELKNFNPSTQRLDGYNYQLQGNVVVETPKMVEKEPTPVIDISVSKPLFMQQLRQERNIRLKASDWTQLVDSQTLFDEETKTKWTVYRQKLRDLPKVYETDETINLSEVTWPGV